MVNASETPALHFQGKDEREVFQFYFHQHWIRLLKPLTIMILWSLVLTAATYGIAKNLLTTDVTTRHGLFIGLYCIFVLVHLRFLIRVYTYFLYAIIVTDRRIHRIKKTLISVDDHQTMDLWSLQDIHKMQHGPIQNLLGFGTLILEAQDTELKLHFVGHIGRIYDRISRLRETARERMPTRKEVNG